MSAAHPSHPVALVTGAARRIGAEIARALHAAGYDLALHYRHSRAEMDALRAELEADRPDSTLALQADLDNVEGVADIVDACVERFGRLDALVNNASTFFPTPVGTVTPAQWHQLFASNAQAPFFLVQAAAPHLRTTHGSIVNLADIYAERPLPEHSVYCMAKAALVMMTQSLAQELGPGVRVNAIAPGAVLWPDSGQDYADRAGLVARTPLRRLGTPSEVAAAVLFLLRDATFTTGQVINVDGGRTLSA